MPIKKATGTLRGIRWQNFENISSDGGRAPRDNHYCNVM